MSYPTADARLPTAGWRAAVRTAFPFLVVGALWEAVAHAGLFHPRLFPPVEAVAGQFVRLTASGVLPHHAADTLARLAAGFGLAAAAGVVVGIVMGRWRLAEDVLLPPVSMAAPIPGIAYAPLFLLWFGPGSVSKMSSPSCMRCRRALSLRKRSITTLTASRCSQVENAESPRKLPSFCHTLTNTS